MFTRENLKMLGTIGTILMGGMGYAESRLRGLVAHEAATRVTQVNSINRELGSMHSDVRLILSAMLNEKAAHRGR